MAYNQVTITTTVQLVIPANTRRTSILMGNEGVTNTIYLGQDTNLTASNGVGLAPGGTLGEVSGGTAVYKGPYYALTSTSTSTLSYWERT